MEWNDRMELNGMDCNGMDYGMEWNGMKSYHNGLWNGIE